MLKRRIPILMATVLISICLFSSAYGAEKADDQATDVRYIEIVTTDVDGMVDFYQSVHGISFGSPDPDLGNARVAPKADGTHVGIRAPLAAHEEPIVRVYLAVEDIQKAVKLAEKSGAVLAYPPTPHGKLGTFAIVIHGEIQHGFWQR